MNTKEIIKNAYEQKGAEFFGKASCMASGAAILKAIENGLDGKYDPVVGWGIVAWIASNIAYNNLSNQKSITETLAVEKYKDKKKKNKKPN